MKKVTLFLLAVSLLPTGVLAWSTPGEDFSGGLKLEGAVTSSRNPWVWKVGEGNDGLEVRQDRSTRGSRASGTAVPLPALTIVLGKTTLTTPAGREGLSPRVIYGKGVEDFSLEWAEPGIAEVTLPVTGEDNMRAGTFVFRMQAAGVLRYMQDGKVVYAGVYDDLNANGLPGESMVMKAGEAPGILQSVFSGEGPSWLQTMTLTGYTGVSHFSDAALRQVDGVYGAQVVTGSGELRLDSEIQEQHWRVSLPVSIEYQ